MTDMITPWYGMNEQLNYLQFVYVVLSNVCYQFESHSWSLSLDPQHLQQEKERGMEREGEEQIEEREKVKPWE